MLLLQNNQLQEELKEYLDVLFDPNNPVYIVLVLAIIAAIVVHSVMFYVFIPIKTKYLLKNKDLQLENSNLMALFTEKNPDPIIRVDANGVVLQSNNAADTTFDLSGNGIAAETILSSIKHNLTEIIETNKSYTYNLVYNSQEYDCTIVGFSKLNFAQIYLHNITDIKLYEAKLISYQDKLSYMSNEAKNELQSEQDRIAKDLHDSLSQNLLAAKLDINEIDTFTQKKEINAKCDKINNLLSGTIESIKKIVKDLKPINFDEINLEDAIQSLFDNFTCVECSIEISDDIPNLSHEKSLCIYRVIQEALTNTIKYANATSFDVMFSFEETDKIISLMISDDGIGFIPDVMGTGRYISDGNGIINIQERILHLKGELEIDSSPGKGTIYIISIPL